MQKKGDGQSSNLVRDRSRTVGSAVEGGTVALKTGLFIGAGNLDVSRFKVLLGDTISTEERLKLFSSLRSAIELLAEAYHSAIQTEKNIPNEKYAAKIEIHQMLKDLKYKMEYCDVLLAAVVSKAEVQVATDQLMIMERLVSQGISNNLMMTNEPMMLSYSKANALYVEARAITAEAAFSAFDQTSKDQIGAKLGAISDSLSQDILLKSQRAVSELHQAANKQVLEFKGSKALADTEKELKAESPKARKKELLKEKKEGVNALRKESSTQLVSAKTASEQFISTIKKSANSTENTVIHYRTMRHAYQQLDTELKSLPQKYVDASVVYSKVDFLETSVEKRRLEVASEKEAISELKSLSQDAKGAIAREDLPAVLQFAESLRDYRALKKELLNHPEITSEQRKAVEDENVTNLKKIIDQFSGDKSLLVDFIEKLENNKPLTHRLEEFVNSINLLDTQTNELNDCRQHVRVFDEGRLIDPVLSAKIAQCQADRKNADLEQKKASSLLLDHFKARKADQKIVKSYFNEVSDYQQKGKQNAKNESDLNSAESKVNELMEKEPESIQRLWAMCQKRIHVYDKINQSYTELKSAREERLEQQPCGVLSLNNTDNIIFTLRDAGLIMNNIKDRSVTFQDTQRDIDIINSSRGMFQKTYRIHEYLDLKIEQKEALKAGIDFSSYNDTVKKHILYEFKDEFKVFCENKSNQEKIDAEKTQHNPTDEGSAQAPPEDPREKYIRYENEFVMIKLKRVSAHESDIQTRGSANPDDFKNGSIISRAVYAEADHVQQFLKDQFRNLAESKSSPVLSPVSTEAQSHRSSYGVMSALMGGAHRERSATLDNTEPANPPSITVQHSPSPGQSAKSDSVKTSESQAATVKSSTEKDNDTVYESSSSTFGNSGS